MFDPDGIGPWAAQLINLPAMGANPGKADIFVQVDWMTPNIPVLNPTQYNQRLSNQAIGIVVGAFRNSPYMSKNGVRGINLHVDEGGRSTLNYSTGATWGALSRAHELRYRDPLGSIDAHGDYVWNDFDADKRVSFTRMGRGPIFHYVIAAHTFDAQGSSGISRNDDTNIATFRAGASDFIVSLGDFTYGTGTDLQQAATFMHELGHNLGLAHGGDEFRNYKPNYLSLMNYSYQFGFIRDGKPLFDYSRSKLDLNESALVEGDGVEGDGMAGAPGYVARWYCRENRQPARPNAAGVLGGAINWNCNRGPLGPLIDKAPFPQDINGDRQLTALTGYKDWPDLRLTGGAIGRLGALPALPMETDPELAG